MLVNRLVTSAYCDRLTRFIYVLLSVLWLTLSSYICVIEPVLVYETKIWNREIRRINNFRWNYLETKKILKIGIRSWSDDGLEYRKHRTKNIIYCQNYAINNKKWPVIADTLIVLAARCCASMAYVVMWCLSVCLSRSWKFFHSWVATQF